MRLHDVLVDDASATSPLRSAGSTASGSVSVTDTATRGCRCRRAASAGTSRPRWALATAHVDARCQLFPARGELGRGRLERAQDTLRPLDDEPARVRERDASAGATHQGHAGLALERGHRCETADGV